MNRPRRAFAALITGLITVLITGLASAVVWSSPTASAAGCDTACKLFTDAAGLSQQIPKPFGWGIGDHAETSTVVWNGQYFMYYRTFISPSGQICGFAQGIALATSGDGGNTWVQHNGGRPLAGLQSVQQYGDPCHNDDGATSTRIFAPDVIVDNGRLLMVFEQRDWRPNGNGPGRGRALHSVRWVTSSNGIGWSNSTRLLKEGPVGDRFDEVGTPDVEKDGSGYVLTFHFHDSTGRLTQGRATVRLPALVEDYSGGRFPFSLSPAPSWANYGMGMGDMRREADGYWYLIFEAFGGANGVCNQSDSQTSVGVARSTDAVNWTVRSAPLIRGVGTSCGWDMPSWQLIGDARGIVTPDDPPNGRELVRWTIVDKVAPVQVTSGSQLRQNQFLPAPHCLGNGSTRLCMQDDGNLVHYRNGDNFVIWASDTSGSRATRAYLQYDGNLVLLRADGSPVRATATDGRPGARLDVLGDRLQIDHYGNTVWQRVSGQRGM
ncbi:hypothetical protein [Herbidospora daliensis]|uniref:hypothetical protein n=1 Tax=Herbidospora daliensis TaxID=295585 RepID=UPI00078603D3|nr:hypothetical protein [Herbidospora daliensis]